jgi:hypothetical protein
VAELAVYKYEQGVGMDDGDRQREAQQRNEDVWQFRKGRGAGGEGTPGAPPRCNRKTYQKVDS